MTKKTIDEVTIQIMDACEEKGWEWIMSRPASNHPDDWYLHYCVIINEKNEAVSYTFNAEFNSFANGHYFNETTKAMRHCEER